MSIEAEWTNKDALSENETTESPEWKKRSRVSIIDFDEFEKATTVNPDEYLVIKTTPEYAQHITQRLKDELNTGKPVVVMLAKDMEAYVVKKSDLKIEAEGEKHGKWEQKLDPYEFFETIPVCSECGCTTKMRDTPPRCPHCGAIMDL